MSEELSKLRQKTMSGVAWQFSERMLSQIITFVLQIILARILFPEDYGLIALISIFTQILLKIVTSGFATGLIQKKDADNLDFSTVFYFSIVISFFSYGLLYVFAPTIARFFDQFPQQKLIDVMRVLGIGLIFSAINSIQRAYVSRNMEFKHFFKTTLWAKVMSAVVGIVMALNGFGVWALVAQLLLESFASLVILWITVQWRPDLSFSFNRLKILFSYGWKIFAASIIKVIYNDIRSFVIGKMYTANDLAFYNRGHSFPQLIDTNIGGTIESVLFPAIAKKQSEPEDVLRILSRAIKTSCFIIMPLLAILAGVGENLVDIILTSKWLPCVIYLQILSFSFFFSPVEIESLQAIKAIGRSDLVLKLEIIKRTVCIALLIVSVPYGVEAIAYSSLAGAFASAVINIIPCRKVLGYSTRQQISDIMPPFILSVIVFCAISGIGAFAFNKYFTLISQLIIGPILYLVMAFAIKLDSITYIKGVIKSKK